MPALPEYQELVWRVSREPDVPDSLLLNCLDDERLLLDPAERRSPSHALSFPLPPFIERDKSRGWRQQRVEAEEARRFGRMLWGALPPPVLEPLLEHQHSGGTVVRLKFTTPVRRVGDFPWEWLTNGHDPVALSPSIRFARVLATRLPVPPLSVDLPLRVLVVTTNPKGERVLELDREIAAISSRLVPPDFALQVLDRADVDVLRELLVEDPPHIIHYVGHGGVNQGEGALILADSNGESIWVGGARVAEELPSCVRLLCLSAFFTVSNFDPLGLPRLARADSSGRLPTTVTNQYPVAELSVKTFWDSFYDGLVHHGGNVNEAVHDGRRAVASTVPESADWASFSYCVRDQTGVSFDLDNVAPAERRRPAEVQAQFAAQWVNELAEQILALGGDVPPTLQAHFNRQMERASGLIGEALSEERE